MFKVHVSLSSHERVSWKEKTKTKNGKEKKNKTQKPTHPQLMAPPSEREEGHRLTDTEIVKVDTTFCKVIGP